MITLGKTFTFEASHVIVGHETCGRTHGHTWTLKVEIDFEKIPPSGMCIDFKVFGGVVKDLIHRRLDHKHLNEEFANEPGLEILTCETLVVWITKELILLLTDLGVSNVDFVALTCELQEGPGGWCRYSEFF